jgi:mttA/Hcf106 family protein
MGFGEMVLIMAVIAAVFGSTKLPGTGDLLGRWLRGDDPRRAPFHLRGERRWRPVDWMLLGTTLALATSVAFTLARRG